MRWAVAPCVVVAVSAGCGTGESPTGGVDSVPGSITIAPFDSTIELGETMTIGAVVRNSAGAPLPQAGVTFSSSDPTVATVDRSSGVVTTLAEGDTDLTASVHSLTASEPLEVRDSMGPNITLLTAIPATVTGTLVVRVRLEDPSGVFGVEMWLNGGIPGPRVLLAAPYPDSVEVTLDWDSSERANGTYSIAVLGYDSSNIQSDLTLTDGITVAN